MIVLRIAKARARAFERLLERENVANWRKQRRAGRFLAASLARLEFGVEEDDARKARR